MAIRTTILLTLEINDNKLRENNNDVFNYPKPSKHIPRSSTLPSLTHPDAALLTLEDEAFFFEAFFSLASCSFLFHSSCLDSCTLRFLAFIIDLEGEECISRAKR